jgi:hypothetical protein
MKTAVNATGDAVARMSALFSSVISDQVEREIFHDGSALAPVLLLRVKGEGTLYRVPARDPRIRRYL